MRADPSVFQLPVNKIRSGYYSDQYFNYAKELVDPNTRVLMQVFQKREGVLGGIDEAIAVLKTCSGYYGNEKHSDHFGDHYVQNVAPGTGDWVNGWDQLTVHAMNEGDPVHPHKPVMYIEGPYYLFAHLETVYLGTLARRTMIASNVTEVCKAANGKPIWYFPARHDHWVVQTGDGFAAYKAGVTGVSSDAQANWWGGKGMGTAPHALIAAFKGDTAAATVAFARKYHKDMNISVLVDYENDCARTAVHVANRMRQENLPLWGVRLDTSESLVDFGLINMMGQFKPTGVNPELVKHVRASLDSAGHFDVKIIVSGGFNAEKIRAFEAQHLPVDAYGVGASLIHGDFAYTADIVQVNGIDESKVGRRYVPNDETELVV